MFTTKCGEFSIYLFDIIVPVIIEMCTLWLRIASYPLIIISQKVIIAGTLNFKMAALRSFNVADEVINTIEEN